MPDQGAPDFHFDILVSPGDSAMLQLLDPYGMKSPNRLAAIQSHIPHELLEMLGHQRMHSQPLLIQAVCRLQDVLSCLWAASAALSDLTSSMKCSMA